MGEVTVNNLPWASDNATVGTDMRKALHYLNGDSTGTKITDKVTKVVFGLNSQYPDIVNNEKGTLMDVEQDVDVNVYYVNENGSYTVYFLSNSKIYAPKDCADLYSNMKALVEVDTGNCDFSRVETMRNMFLNCTNLAVMNTNDWDVSNVSDMYQMFRNCNKLVANVGDWDVSKVTNMYAMFAYNDALTELDLSKWQVGNVQDMGAMFNACSNLTELDVSTWDTSSVTRFFATFQDCHALPTVDVSGWDISNATDVSQMFQRCYKLAGLDTSKWDTGNVTTMMMMFRYCYQLAELDVSGWDTGNVERMNSMFSGNYVLKELDVSNWDVSKVTTFSNLFARENQNAGDMKLKEVDMSSFDTSNVTIFGQLFEVCYALERVYGLENWDTSKGNDFSEMFSGCGSLKELNLSSFDTRNANSNPSGNWVFLRFMSGCSGLEKVTFGPYFSFDGIGTCPDDYKFVMPGATGVEGWDGKWYNAETGVGYAPSEIPEETAAVYLAVNPNTG